MISKNRLTIGRRGGGVSGGCWSYENNGQNKQRLHSDKEHLQYFGEAGDILGDVGEYFGEVGD